MIVSGIPIAVRRPGKLLSFTYTGGKYGYTEDGLGNWELRLYTGGVLTMNFDCSVDIFAVGGGGSGGLPNITQSSGNYNIKQAGGGGGGYTTTVSNYSLLRGDVLTAVIGTGGDASEITSLSGIDGGTTKMFTGTVEGSGTSVISANGGKGGEFSWSYPRGGDGGSGGGLSSDAASAGGTNGGNGEGTYGGTGQGTTTRAFGEENGELFSGGGGGGAMVSYNAGAGGAGGGGKGGGRDGNKIFGGKDALPNTGGGGGGGGVSVVSTLSDDLYVSTSAGSGGSGIIILRNHRTAS